MLYVFQQGQVLLHGMTVKQHEYCIGLDWMNDTKKDADQKLYVCNDATVMSTHKYHSIRYTILPICMYHYDMSDKHTKLHHRNWLFALIQFRYANVCAISDHHISHLWMHSVATKFEWEMFVVLFGHVGIRLHIVVGSSAQQFKLHATIAVRLCRISRLFYSVLSISLVECH